MWYRHKVHCGAGKKWAAVDIIERQKHLIAQELEEGKAWEPSAQIVGRMGLPVAEQTPGSSGVGLGGMGETQSTFTFVRSMTRLRCPSGNAAVDYWLLSASVSSLLHAWLKSLDGCEGEKSLTQLLCQSSWLPLECYCHGLLSLINSHFLRKLLQKGSITDRNATERTKVRAGGIFLGCLFKASLCRWAQQTAARASPDPPRIPGCCPGDTWPLSFHRTFWIS